MINIGVIMVWFGVSVGVLSYVGDDVWVFVIYNLLCDEGVDDLLFVVCFEVNISIIVVVIDGCGECSFFYCVGVLNLFDG